MPVVFIIATDWSMRIGIRAELREMGIDALGMDSADDISRGISSGSVPNVVVLEATAEFLGDPRIQNLVQRVPTILVASRTEKVSLPNAAVILYRPVRIADIVYRVNELLAENRTV